MGILRRATRHHFATNFPANGYRIRTDFSFGNRFGFIELSQLDFAARARGNGRHLQVTSLAITGMAICFALMTPTAELLATNEIAGEFLFFWMINRARQYPFALAAKTSLLDSERTSFASANVTCFLTGMQSAG